MRSVKCITICVLVAAMLLGCMACNFVAPSAPTADVSAAATGTPVVEKGSSSVILTVTEAPITPPPTPTPTPTPEPTPVPAPTEIPFSYYAPTVAMTFEELVGASSDFDENNPKSDETFLFPVAYPAPDTYRIIVDLYWQVVMVFSKDETGAYTVPVRYMLCSTGDPRVGSETRVGEWPMQPCKVRFGFFNVSGESAQYWSLIRSCTYFHSVLYSKYRNLNSLVVESYKKLGTKASHACIRLTVPDARWIFYNICYDTICEIRKGSKDDTATQAIKSQLILPEVPASYTISTETTPYTDNWTVDSIVTDPAYPYVYATQPPVNNS